MVVLEVFLKACLVAVCTRYKSGAFAPVNCALAKCERAYCRHYPVLLAPVGRVLYLLPFLARFPLEGVGALVGEGEFIE